MSSLFPFHFFSLDHARMNSASSARMNSVILVSMSLSMSNEDIIFMLLQLSLLASFFGTSFE